MASSGAATPSAVSVDSDALSYLWAQKRIERLTNYGLDQNNPDVKEAVTQIGLTYSILTPYTSFIAVIETIRNPNQDGSDVNQPLPLPLGVSNFAVGGYLFGSEPTEFVLIGALAFFILMQLPYVKKRFRRKRTHDI